MASLKPYPQTKDSGIEWLGDVPEHWHIERGKNLFTRVERPVHATDEVVTCFRDGTVTLRRNRRTEGFTESLKEIGYQGICAGDLVIHAMDAAAGAAGVSDARGKGTPVYAVCEPKPGVNAHYHAFVIREMARNGWILALSTGIRERSTDFRFGAYAEQRVPAPPLREQEAMVRYLDHVDRQARKLVQAKQRLIDLLGEQKQAIIHRAVTRGLNPDAPLKPSGVSWLGDIPEHWEVRRLCSMADISASNVDKHTKEGEIPVRLCNYTDVYAHDRIHDSMGFMQATATAEEIDRFRLAVGDVILTKDSEAPDDIGVPALVTETALDLVCGYHLTLLRPDPARAMGAFLLWALQHKGTAYQFHVEAKGVTRFALTYSGIKQARIPLPPLSEQIAIAGYLEGATANIASAIAQAEREIKLLNEYRTRLIADVVTGKLDVREAAAGLPEVAPPEGDDEPGA